MRPMPTSGGILGSKDITFPVREMEISILTQSKTMINCYSAESWHEGNKPNWSSLFKPFLFSCMQIQFGVYALH
jgi:hypothetical protein